MDTDDGTREEELRIFLLEGYELIDQVEHDLTVLERTPDDLSVVHTVFRSVHTLKGNSGFYQLAKLEGLCHKGEALLDKLRGGSVSVTPDRITVLLSFSDAVRGLMLGLEHHGAEPDVDLAELSTALVRAAE